jgi:hypothetical protein
MLNRLDEASDDIMKALGEIERDKLRVAWAYNKRVKEICFKLGISFRRWFYLLGPKATNLENGHWIGKHHIEYEEAIPGKSYMVQTIQGTSLLRALNEKYLKRYYPRV